MRLFNFKKRSNEGITQSVDDVLLKGILSGNKIGRDEALNIRR